MATSDRGMIDPRDQLSVHRWRPLLRLSIPYCAT